MYGGLLAVTGSTTYGELNCRQKQKQMRELEIKRGSRCWRRDCPWSTGGRGLLSRLIFLAGGSCSQTVKAFSGGMNVFIW